MSGARSGRGSVPARFHGASMNSKQVRNVTSLPVPASLMPLQWIVRARGATPMRSPRPSSPTSVPVVCVP